MSRSRIALHIILLVSFVLPFTLPQPVLAQSLQPVEEVIPGGQSLGIKLHSSGVLVAGFSDVSSSEDQSPAQEAGIETGDIILQLNGHKIDDMQSFKTIMTQYEKQADPIQLLIKRKEQIFPIEVTPVQDQNQDIYKLGLYIRDATEGIGTLTFYDPVSKRYAALGHVIADQQSKKPLDIFDGHIVLSDVTSINKGESGSPGEKRARIPKKRPGIGTIQKNSDYGIYGEIKSDEFLKDEQFDAIPIARASDVKEGKAQMLTVINGQKVERFDVEIVSSVPSKNPETKGMVIQVTDDELLEASGGIVQGMSGSPIIQDGRIVGAVTHVFLNDPTSGYGVHLEWMLEEAGLTIQESEQQQAS
ncbi:stage IV sporulation protein B [Alkalibacillus flavidus]|uniref:Stage IV sporulation protein B n=1 Tax=Alkalibacillus flavidus TaxID=546021 RepID=A0ABV2KXK4_9BACI